MYSCDGMVDWLGDNEGMAVYCLILDGYWKEGGVPRTVEMENIA